MREYARQFNRTKEVWIPAPPALGTLPQLALNHFRDVLTVLSEDDLRAGRYKFHYKTTREPDDGIILKDPDIPDESTLEHGLAQDCKVFLQFRKRTEELLRSRPGAYHPEFQPLLDVCSEMRAAHLSSIREFVRHFARERPELAGIEVDEEEIVWRIMVYLKTWVGEGKGEPVWLGKPHVDRSHATIHIYDSMPGFAVKRPAGVRELITAREGQNFMFWGKRLEKLTGVPGVEHGAIPVDTSADHKRGVVVCFIHLLEPKTAEVKVPITVAAK